MLKRSLDIFYAFLGLLISAPILLLAVIAIWLEDRASPFYIAPRVGQDGRLFSMVKLRSMIIDADRFKIGSTSSNDPRLTIVGTYIRKYKIDELAQLWNVLIGDMSLVGPRPNVKREVDLYTSLEQNLLSIKPGITDIASIVFSDLNDLLQDSKDPNLDYNQLIRPWKSRLGLLYVENRSFILDIKLIYLTVVALISRRNALNGIQKILCEFETDEIVKEIADRRARLIPFPPPGSDEIVKSRELPQTA